MMLFMGPPGAATVSDFGSRRRDWGAKAMPPLWQYFSRLGNKRERALLRSGVTVASAQPCGLERPQVCLYSIASPRLPETQ
jgi:hypothetical protein